MVKKNKKKRPSPRKVDCIRLHHSQPRDFKDRWQKQATKEGKSLSQWIAECCNAKLGR